MDRASKKGALCIQMTGRATEDKMQNTDTS